MSAVRNVFFENYKRNTLEVFLKNGVTLRGRIELWDEHDFVISCYNSKTGQTMYSLVPMDAYYSIKNKNEGTKNGK